MINTLHRIVTIRTLCLCALFFNFCFKNFQPTYAAYKFMMSALLFHHILTLVHSLTNHHTDDRPACALAAALRRHAEAKADCVRC